MLSLSERSKQVAASSTLAITAKINQMVADGLDVVKFGAGEPDFDTPEHIKEAGIDSIQAGFTKYTPVAGISELKNAIVTKFKNDNNLNYEPSEVIVNCGAKHTIYNILQAICNPGDEVIFAAPYWVSYIEMVKLADGIPIVVETTADQNFCLTADQIAAVVTDKTKAVIINSPSNPTGTVYDHDALREIAGLATDKNFYVISDEIYESLLYDGNQHCSIAAFDSDIQAITFVVNGVSKAYSMTGWRIGYAGGPVELIQAMSKLQSQSTSNPSSISQAAAVEGLNGPQDFIAKHNDVFKARRDLVVSMLNQAKGVECLIPDGAFYVYPSVAGCINKNTPDGKKIENDLDFSTALLETEGVAVVHGAAFGLSPHFRISYATSTESLQDACQRIQRFCASLK